MAENGEPPSASPDRRAIRVRVPGFSPSANGLRFANAFPSAPFWRLRFGSLVRVEIGDVATGLCGGMTFVAADLHRAGLPPPSDTSAPPDGAPLRALIRRRQLDSLDRGRLPLRFYSLASPLRPARETWWTRALGWLGIDLHSRMHVMVVREWPRIRRGLEAGRLVPLGVVRAVSANPLRLARHHQVLAWGYDLDGTRLALRIYDPNWPGDDEVTIALDLGDPDGDAAPASSRPDGPVVAFFRAPYRPAQRSGRPSLDR